MAASELGRVNAGLRCWLACGLATAVVGSALSVPAMARDAEPRRVLLCQAEGVYFRVPAGWRVTKQEANKGSALPGWELPPGRIAWLQRGNYQIVCAGMCLDSASPAALREATRSDAAELKRGRVGPLIHRGKMTVSRFVRRRGTGTSTRELRGFLAVSPHFTLEVTSLLKGTVGLPNWRQTADTGLDQIMRSLPDGKAVSRR